MGGNHDRGSLLDHCRHLRGARPRHLLRWLTSMTTPELIVRPAISSDVKPLAAVLARAFYDDPPSVWLLPEPRPRQARLRRVFATIMRAEALRRRTVDVAWAGDEIAGGT